MHCASSQFASRRQRGYTLLLILLVLLVGGTSVYLTARDPASARTAQELQQSAIALDRATVALQFYSAAADTRPGSLPCPAEDDSGTAALFSGDECPVYLARLPWRTIDAAREVGNLWYVMDRDFRDHGNAEPVNVVVEGSLNLDGESGYAALLIDPGDPLAGQTGRPSNDPSDYLEGENADGDEMFVNCAGLNGCNERITGIRVDPLFQVVQRRVLAEIEQRLRTFHDDNGFLPFAAPFDSDRECAPDTFVGRVATQSTSCGAGNTLQAADFDNWINDNDWLDHVVYRVAEECTQGQSGCTGADLQLNDDTGLSVVLGAAGTEFAGQDRSAAGPDIADFLDSNENTDGDKAFDDASLSDIDNDILRGIGL